MDNKEPTEPLAEIYRIWKEHFTFTYKGEKFHVGWLILLVSMLALAGYLGRSVPLDYR